MAQAPHTPIVYDPYAPLHITFDDGWQTIGDIYHADTSVPGQVTLASDMTLGHSMFKEWSDGPASGHGYGTYTFVAKLDGYLAGPGIVLWPGDDKWPGPEIDLAELMPDWTGRQYGTMHWDGGGYDDYYSQLYPGYVEPGVVHTYQMTWAPGKVTMTVDGEHKIDWSVNVPADYAHGGVNLTLGAINLNLDTSITVYDIKYDPLDPSLIGHYTSLSGTSLTGVPPADATTTPATTPPPEVVTDPAPVPATDPAPAPAEQVDWNAIAAQVQANYEATGTWYVPSTSTPTTTTTTPTPTTPVPTDPAPVTDTHTDTSTTTAPVDWNALAAQAEANYAATGSWWI